MIFIKNGLVKSFGLFVIEVRIHDTVFAVAIKACAHAFAMSILMLSIVA